MSRRKWLVVLAVVILVSSVAVIVGVLVLPPSCASGFSRYAFSPDPGRACIGVVAGGSDLSVSGITTRANAYHASIVAITWKVEVEIRYNATLQVDADMKNGSGVSFVVGAMAYQPGLPFQPGSTFENEIYLNRAGLVSQIVSVRIYWKSEAGRTVSPLV